MNKLVMNYFVMERFKVTPRICHDAIVQGFHEQARHELPCHGGIQGKAKVLDSHEQARHELPCHGGIQGKA